MQLNGIVVFRLSGIGTRSEGIRPFLYLGKAVYRKIWKAEDTSLNGVELMAYDSKHVIVHGEVDEYDIFIIEKVEEAGTTDSEINNSNNNDNISTEEEN